MAGVYLRYGVITVTNPDGTATSGKRFEVPRRYFQPKGITHREEAKGTPGVVSGGTFTVRGASREARAVVSYAMREASRDESRRCRNQFARIDTMLLPHGDEARCQKHAMDDVPVLVAARVC